MTVESRFLSKIKRPEASECWVWTGCLSSKGYGRIKVCGKTEMAHRVSYKLYCGEVSDETNVLHHCDSPPCVNPDHLFLGTQADNIADMISKGRAKLSHPGEKAKRSKLTWEQVNEIRASSLPLRKLAREFGMSWSAIGMIKRGENWRGENGQRTETSRAAQA